jgi:4-carboxymuconolactone decarboxylase
MTTARLPLVSQRRGLSAEAEAAWDAIVSTRGLVSRPFAILLNSPETARRVAELGAHLRFQAGLDDRLRETAILVTAYLTECTLERESHEPIALKAGVSEADLALLRSGQLEDLADDLQGVARFATKLLREHRVTDADFAPMLDRLGARGTTDLITTVGYYSMLACILNSMDADSA